jgi:hypothetical protein
MDAARPENDSQCRTWLVVPGGGRSRNLYRGNPEPANYTLSLASAPAYSDGGENVTITMKGWKWPTWRPWTPLTGRSGPIRRSEKANITAKERI